MQRRVFDSKAVVAHGAVHVHNGMATGAGQSGARFRGIHLGLDWPFKTAVEEHSMVVASGAPLAPARRALRVLHVFDGFSVELVIERSEMVRRGLPFVVDLLVALAAGFRIHEKIRWNNSAHV